MRSKTRIPMPRLAFYLLVATACLAGCAQITSPAIDPVTAAPVSTAAPTPLPPPPTATASPIPTLPPPTRTAMAAPTATFTPTPLPMGIRAMQAGNYPGSEITIEKELDPGANYRRYDASYLSEGLKIYALLTVPDGEVPPGGWPGIVFNHGYIPPEVYRTTERYVAYVDRLARAGYVVFRIDYRGHDRSEGIAAGAYGDPGYTVDVLNAVASLQRFPQANPQKIGMWGHSMGGFLTLRAMVISPEIKAGVIWGGVVGSYADMICCWRHAGLAPTPPPIARRWRAEWTALYGSPEQNPRFWNSISANAFLGDLSGPLQLDYGSADEDVPPAFSQALAQAVQAAGGTVEIFSYPGDDHNIANYFTQAMDNTIAFFDRYLKEE